MNEKDGTSPLLESIYFKLSTAYVSATYSDKYFDKSKVHVLLILTVFTRAKAFKHFELREPEAGAPRAPSLAESGKRNLWKTEAICEMMEKCV